jgi:uncharacterized protein YkwD
VKTTLLALCALLLCSVPVAAKDEVRARAKADERCARRVRKLVEDFASPRARKLRERGLAQWTAARDAALAVIFDETLYPDADHGRAGQPLVDEKVEAVRPVWAALDALVRRDLAPLLSLEPAQAAALLADARQVDGEAVDAAALALLAVRAGEPAGGELPPWEALLAQRARDAQVLAENALVATATPAEREQVRLTNEYRLMLGRPALRLDARLVASARGHALDMERLGFFDHTSPVPGKASFQERIAAAGYPSPGGENIALGMTTPQAAHLGWYRSSGHHRNLLSTSFTAMGAGAAGKHWVQNFGG